MFRKQAIIFLIVGLTASCIPSCKNPERYKAEIVLLDSLHALADSVLGQLSSIDSIQLISQTDSADAQINAIISASDTVSRDTALLLAQLDKKRHSLKVIAEALPKLKVDLLHAKKQNRALRQDLQTGAVEEQKAKQYVSSEKERMMRLCRSGSLLLEANKAE